MFHQVLSPTQLIWLDRRPPIVFDSYFVFQSETGSITADASKTSNRTATGLSDSDDDTK
jgi:hypothetical protein